MSTFTVKKLGRFEASHILVGHKGKCGRLHGHSYKFEVTVTGRRLSDVGMLMDFTDIPIKRIEAVYDHRHLNDIGSGVVWVNDETGIGMYDVSLYSEGEAVPNDEVGLALDTTSAECIAQKIFEFADKVIGSRRDYDCFVQSVTVWETEKCSATYARADEA